MNTCRKTALGREAEGGRAPAGRGLAILVGVCRPEGGAAQWISRAAPLWGAVRRDIR